jgi:UDP-N-acetylmuramoylalanine--D-glutamate ligase
LELNNKKVLVVGLAKTGLAVGRFLVNQKARVAAADLMTEEQLGSHAQEALAMGMSLILGPHEAETFLGYDLIVLSPGVPHTLGPVEAARQAGIPVIGELELAVGYINGPIVAVTGTNGKTTTTNLVGEMLRASGFEVFVGGNIGDPLIGHVDSGVRSDIIVAEISSFQLDTIESFRPKVGVLLNISEDHLDRYIDFQDYVRSKGRLFENQEGTDVAVLNRADPIIHSMAPAIRAQKLYFNINSDSSAPTQTMPLSATNTAGLPQGGGQSTGGRSHAVELRDGKMICRLPGKAPLALSLAKFKIKGLHNLENAAAASLAALAAGAVESGIQKALDTFKGLPHRLEHVRTVNGVQYYNDSKGTNVGAVVRALESFDTPVILIMGGRDKGGGYGVLEDLVKKRVKMLLATGEARKRILDSLGGFADAQEAISLEEAVHRARQAATPGDVVLLSPGCSSFDMFSDYAERGETFCKAVLGLDDQ